MPERPSAEHLRKQAKRLAKASGIGLAAAQARLARDYGFSTWAELIRAVDAEVGKGEAASINAALWLACRDEADPEQRLAVAERLLGAGASPRHGFQGGTTALHQAAGHGPLALVELLIRHGAKTWQADNRGRDALIHARRGKAKDAEAIAELLDRPVIRDPRFRAAVTAIHAGDLAGLNALLDAHPDLLHVRAIEPDCYSREDYFTDPKLFWFVANNPNQVERAAPNVVAVAEAMIARGVEAVDLNYTLELVLTGRDDKLGGRQAELAQALMRAGATPGRRSLMSALAEGSDALVVRLVEGGAPLTAALAAGLGRQADLLRMLPSLSADELHAAFSLAVVKRRVEAARVCLEAGAEVDRRLLVHAHSNALHQAAINGDLAMITLLLDHGARQDLRDSLWDGTPLGWAVHGKQTAAEALLRARGG